MHTTETQDRVENKEKISREFLAHYISYARKFCNPTIPEASVQLLVSAYTSMRALGNSRNTITATPRQLESMIRLSEALAKMQLSDTVEKRHIDEAKRLISVALRQSATNPITGEIDMDLITTGQSSSSKEKIAEIVAIIRQVLVSSLS